MGSFVFSCNNKVFLGHGHDKTLTAHQLMRLLCDPSFSCVTSAGKNTVSTVFYHFLSPYILWLCKCPLNAVENTVIAMQEVLLLKQCSYTYSKFLVNNMFLFYNCIHNYSTASVLSLTVHCCNFFKARNHRAMPRG